MKDLFEKNKDLETINETHQQLNNELRSELQKAQTENIKKQKIYCKVIKK